MTHDANQFPSWGASGTFPEDGFSYQQGDQVSEASMDALWNGIQTHFDKAFTQIADRTIELIGHMVMDGLMVSAGSGTTVSIQQSTQGAYVDGHFTGPIDATTITLGSNGTTTARTDTIYVTKDGVLKSSSGTTSAPNETMKLAEADVETSDTISAVRNYSPHVVYHAAGYNTPSYFPIGSIFYDYDDDSLHLITEDGEEVLASEGDLQTIDTINGDLTIGGNLFVNHAIHANTKEGISGDTILDGEAFRVGTSFSDLLLQVTDGDGRAGLAYNCYFDEADSTWRSISAAEPNMVLGYGLGQAGFGTGNATLTLATAPSTGTADGAIDSWNVIGNDQGDLRISNGNIYCSGNLSSVGDVNASGAISGASADIGGDINLGNVIFPDTEGVVVNAKGLGGNGTGNYNWSILEGTPLRVWNRNNKAPVFDVEANGNIRAQHGDYVQLPVHSSTLSSAPNGACYFVE